MERNERLPLMKKVQIGLILLMALGPACVMPWVTMDKYLALKKQYEETITINNDNVELCLELYEKFKLCTSTLETCMHLAVPDYVPPENKTQEL